MKTYSETDDRIIVNLKKSFKGLIDIRSTIVSRARKVNKPIHVTCDDYPNEQAVYTVKDLNNPVRIQGPYSSTYSEDYYLHVFPWKKKVDNDSQLSLF